MKMKSAVLASALVAVSSAFATIYSGGDIYNSWFTAGSGAQTKIDTALNTPVIVNENTVATKSNGYAVTAEVSVVIHAALPDVPAKVDNVSPKGSICAADVNGTAKWYGLQNDSGTYSWVPLTIDGSDSFTAPTENTTYTLVTEFDDLTSNNHRVRYSVISGNTTQTSAWYTSGHANALQKVGLAGTGYYTKVVGLLVNAWTGTSIEAVPITISKDMLAAMGVSTANTTPAEIITALKKPQDNGIAAWANYVLGITEKVTDTVAATKKPFAAPVQNSTASTLTFKLGGVNPPDGTGATVKYAIETLASPDAESGDLSDYVAAGTDKTITLDSSKVQYYRVKVQIDQTQAQANN